MIDIVILSNAKTPELKQITDQAIMTLGEGFNVTIAEQNPTVFYNVKTYHYDYEFNYNKIVNDVLKKGTAKYVCWANNDVVFTEGWADKLISEMKKYDADSCSPYCPETQGYKLYKRAWKGYNVTQQLNGWCIFAKRETLEKIGWLKEDFKFWFADNIYGWQLEHNNLSHYLFTKSIVYHLNTDRVSGATFKTLTPEQQAEYKAGYELFAQKYKRKMTRELAELIINNNDKQNLREAIEFMKQVQFKQRQRKIDCQNEILDTLDKYGCKLNGKIQIDKNRLLQYINNTKENVITLDLSENNFEINNV